jgi:hypothetical protein
VTRQVNHPVTLHSVEGRLRWMISLKKDLGTSRMNLLSMKLANPAFLFLVVFLLIPSVYAQTAILHSNWAQVNNTSIIKGMPTSSIFGSEPAPIYLAGIIKNVGNETQYKIKLILSLFDSNNKLIGVEDGTPEIENLSVNDTTPYKVKVSSNISSLDHYMIQFDVCDKTRYECNV